MAKLKIADIAAYDRADLAQLSREELEDWAWRSYEWGRGLTNQLAQNSTNSSRPPSSDDPYRRSGRGGKKPGAPGYWRTQPLVTTKEDVKHFPPACDCCPVPGPEQKIRQVSARSVCDLDRSEMGLLRITVIKHCYFAVTWGCGHETIARPGVGLSSDVVSG